MRVLLSAIACHPEHGSEAAVGWKSAMALALKHEVHVLTSESNRESITAWTREKQIENPSFHFFGVDAPYCENRLIARGQSWLRYAAWTKESLARAGELVDKIPFDVVHHATFSTCRVASPLWKLGIPTVVGPVGGGESTPMICLGSMSWQQRLYEITRFAANAALPLSPNLRRAVAHTGIFVASNMATRLMLLRLGARPGRIMQLPVVFFTEEQLAAMPSRHPIAREPNSGLKLFASGILEGRKGISIVLEAMHMAKARGVRCEITIPSQGPELQHLRRLARKLGLEREALFPDTLARGAYWENLLGSDIYAMPSLRDNCPATLLEAMLCGCAPVIADCNGPGEMVPEGSGIKLPPMEPRAMAESMAEALIDLDADRAKLSKLGENAEMHVRRTFTEKRYLETIGTAYERAVSRD